MENVDRLFTGDPRNVYDQELYKKVLNPKECQRQLNFLSNSSLALPFLDATGTIPSGIMSLNINDYGDFNECLKINENVQDMSIQGKFCFIGVPLNQNLTMPTWHSMIKLTKNRLSKTGKLAHDINQIKANLTSQNITSNFVSKAFLRLGVCVPKVCTVKEVDEFVQPRLDFPDVKVYEGSCRLPGDKMFTAADYIAFGFFAVLLLLTILSTSYDLYQVFIRKKSRPNQMLTMFSIYTNTKHIVDSRPTKSALACVDGIRALSMFWVICGHAYSFQLMSPAHNILDMRDWTMYFRSTWINSAPIVVDTFFMLSGLFCIYVLPRKLSPLRFLKGLHIFYLYRYLRTLPLLAVAVLLQASVANWIADGPDWHRMAYATDVCRQRWWATLLHASNYVRPAAVCVFQSWYLAVDMQLYIVSPVIIICVLVSSTVAWFALTSSLIASLGVLAYYILYYEFPSATNGLWYSPQSRDYILKFYVHTPVRASPFVVGMMFGYIMWKQGKNTMMISQKRVLIYWILSLVSLAYCFFAINTSTQLPYEFNYYDFFYNCIMRAIWAAALGWIILACTYGYGGPIDWFLSHEMWRVLSKISYAVYLTHLQVVMVHTNSVMKPRYFVEIETLYACASYILITSVVGFVLCVFVDEPFATMLKLAFSQKRKRQPNIETKTEEIDENKTKL